MESSIKFLRLSKLYIGHSLQKGMLPLDRRRTSVEPMANDSFQMASQKYTKFWTNKSNKVLFK